MSKQILFEDRNNDWEIGERIVQSRDLLKSKKKFFPRWKPQNSI